MASDFFTINLNTALQTFSMEGVTSILSTFSCALNNDIERFLKERAIEFSNKGIARTHICDKVTDIQNDLGGRFVYLECESKPKLIDFYNANGFRIVADSQDETGLIQMILFQ